VFAIGTSLRDARIRQGFDLTDAEAATKIRAKYLQALEEEHFEVLPAQTYVKGFLYSYAEYLGLDGQLYVDEFNSRHAGPEEDLSQRPRRRHAPSRAHSRVESRMVLAALVAIAALSALVVAAWKTGDGEQTTIPNLATGPAAPAAPAGGEGEDAAAAPRRPAALSIAAVDGPSALTINKMSASGELVYTGTLEQGKSLSFTWRQFWLQAEQPANLRVRVNGALVQLGTGRQPVQVLVSSDGVRPAASG
jgi:cytoskeleton protein RodZ